MSKERLIAFTDALLAIIMTILVLELAKPSEPTLAAFWALRTNYFAYVLSFFWLGSLWTGLNFIWENVKRIDGTIIRRNILLLFLASLFPYATSLCSTYFYNRTTQAFYGIVTISMTICNYYLNQALDKPNQDSKLLLMATSTYRKILFPDITIKSIGLILALLLYPPLMMYSVLVSAIYVITKKQINERKYIKYIVKGANHD